MKLHIWTDRFSYLAVAHADSVSEARELLLKESDLGESGDGSCPERDKARRAILSETSAVYVGRVAEFSLSDNAQLREQEAQSENLHQQLAAKDRRIAELSEQLEHDRTLVCDSLRLAREALHAYSWLMDGRGSYEWDDDQWKSEFRDAVAAIKEAIAPMVKVAADWRGCPQTGAEIAAARVDLKRRIAELEAALGAIEQALRCVEINPSNYTVGEVVALNDAATVAYSITDGTNRPVLDALLAQAKREAIDRCIAIAKGCEDYGGGYREQDLEIYHHGMQTVHRCLMQLRDGDESLQLRTVESVGRRMAREVKP